MKATLTDANGFSFDLDAVYTPSPLAPINRPLLDAVAGHDPKHAPNTVTIPIPIRIPVSGKAPSGKVPNPLFTPPPIRGKNKRRRGRR